MDRGPIVLDTSPISSEKKEWGRFEAVWLLESDTGEIVEKVWKVSMAGSHAFQLMQHQIIVLRHLRNWHNQPSRRLDIQISQTRRKFEEVQKISDLGVKSYQDYGLRRKFDDLFQWQEVYWAQRTRLTSYILVIKTQNTFIWWLLFGLIRIR